MDQFRRREEDKGVESPWVILGRIDERLKAMEKQQATASENVATALLAANKQLDQHFHEDKGNFAEVRARVEVEGNKIRKEHEASLEQTLERLEKIDTNMTYIFRCGYIAVGALIIINIFFVPVIVKNLVNSMVVAK